MYSCFCVSVTACVTVTVWERAHVRRADAETHSCRLTAGSSWTASPVTQTQSRPSAPARRKSPPFIQTGIGQRKSRNKGGRQFPRIKTKQKTHQCLFKHLYWNSKDIWITRSERMHIWSTTWKRPNTHEELFIYSSTSEGICLSRWGIPREDYV